MVIEFHHCWGWLIEERVDIFVIEKYIEINKGIMYGDLDPHSTMLQYNRRNYARSYIYSKGHYQKVYRVALAGGYKKQQ